jgi:hypothetical protein
MHVLGPVENRFNAVGEIAGIPRGPTRAGNSGEFQHGTAVADFVRILRQTPYV